MASPFFVWRWPIAMEENVIANIATIPKKFKKHETSPNTNPATAVPLVDTFLCCSLKLITPFLSIYYLIPKSIPNFSS